MPLSITEPFPLTFALDWLDMLDLDMHGGRRHSIVLDYCNLVQNIAKSIRTGGLSALDKVIT